MAGFQQLTDQAIDLGDQILLFQTGHLFAGQLLVQVQQFRLVVGRRQILSNR